MARVPFGVSHHLPAGRGNRGNCMEKSKLTMSTSEKSSVESYLAVIKQAIAVEEYEVALTTLENLKEMIVDKLMVKHHGGA